MTKKKITQKCSGGNTNPRARNYCVTLNNYTEDEYKNFCECNCKYIVVGREVGESGTPHLQIYIEFNEGISMTQLKKRLLCNKLHCEKRMGTAEQASDYCKKDGDFFEKGSLSKQGARQDLVELKDKIMNGSSVASIAIDNPIVYHQYGRTLNYIEDLKMRKLHRSKMTKGYWIYGSTGSGKSEMAFENYSPETHYIWKYDNGWNDGYAQQDIVIIDEFRGQLRFSELLAMCDKHPNCFVNRRGREPLPFISKKVIITSSLHPSEIFTKLAKNDSMDQLYRRFKIICSNIDLIDLD